MSIPQKWRSLTPARGDSGFAAAGRRRWLKMTIYYQRVSNLCLPLRLSQAVSPLRAKLGVSLEWKIGTTP
jgi:hypothetical protein